MCRSYCSSWPLPDIFPFYCPSVRMRDFKFFFKKNEKKLADKNCFGIVNILSCLVKLPEVAGLMGLSMCKHLKKQIDPLHKWGWLDCFDRLTRLKAQLLNISVNREIRSRSSFVFLQSGSSPPSLPLPVTVSCFLSVTSVLCPWQIRQAAAAVTRTSLNRPQVSGALVLLQAHRWHAYRHLPHGDARSPASNDIIEERAELSPLPTPLLLWYTPLGLGLELGSF